MNTYEKWFSGVGLVGVVFNLWFGISSLFFPSYLINVIGIDSDFDTIWMRDAGMLLIAGSVFHALTARAPDDFSRSLGSWSPQDSLERQCGSRFGNSM